MHRLRDKTQGTVILQEHAKVLSIREIQVTLPCIWAYRYILHYLKDRLARTTQQWQWIHFDSISEKYVNSV